MSQTRQTAQPTDKYETRVDSLLKNGFSETNMQFNIGRIRGLDRRGYDLIDGSGNNRILVTTPNSERSAAFIKHSLGSHAVLEQLEGTSDFSVYQVPTGARLLKRTMEVGPYAQPYMQALGLRAMQFMARLSELDEHGFGLGTHSIALTHNGIDEGGVDDAHLTVVPPVDEPAHALHWKKDASSNGARHYHGQVDSIEMLADKGMDNDATFTYYSGLINNSGSQFDLSVIGRYFPVTRGVKG